MSVVEVDFDIGESVSFGNNGEITGHVALISIRGTGHISYEVEWWADKELKSAWLYAWQLTKAEQHQM